MESIKNSSFVNEVSAGRTPVLRSMYKGFSKDAVPPRVLSLRAEACYSQASLLPHVEGPTRSCQSNNEDIANFPQMLGYCAQQLTPITRTVLSSWSSVAVRVNASKST